MKKFALAFSVSLMTISSALASPERAVTSTTKMVMSGAQPSGEVKQGYISREAKFQVAPTSLEYSKLYEKKLDGNIGESGAATSTGAMSAPGI